MLLRQLKAVKLFVLLLVFSVGVIFANAATKHVNVGAGILFTDVSTGSTGPAQTTIFAGDTVEWDWLGGGHSTTSGTCGGSSCTADGLWNSPVQGSGSFSHTFNTPGTFHYFCVPHQALMQGVVIVVPRPDFSVSVPSTSGGTIFPGQQVMFNGSLSPLNGYNQTVGLSCQQGESQLPSPCTPNPTSAMVSSLIPFTITAGATTVGHYDFAMQASDGTNTHLFPGLNFDVVDFAAAAPTPSSTTVFTSPSSTALSSSTSIMLSGAGVFAGNVALACSAGLPAGATCNFTPSGPYMPTAASPVPVTVTVTIPAATAAQDYSLTLSASSATTAGTVIKTQSLTLHVVQFAAAAFSPGSITIGAGNTSNTATTHITGSTNFTGSGTVTLACTAGLPSGGACSFSPARVSSYPTDATVIASVPFNTSAGTPTLTVTATGNINGVSASQTQTLNLNVPAPDFSLGTPSQTTVSMVNNSFSQPVTVLLTPTNLAGVVALSCGSLPANVSCIFSPPGLVPVKGQPSSFAVTFASSGATPGGYTGITLNADITINGTPISHNVGLTQLNIAAPGTSTTITSSLAAANSATNGALINVGDPNLTITATVDNSGNTYSGAVWQVNFSNPVVLVASSNPNCGQLLPTAISCNLGDIAVSTGNHYSFRVSPLFARSVVTSSMLTSATVGSSNLTGNSATAPAVQVRVRPLARKGLVPKTP